MDIQRCKLFSTVFPRVVRTICSIKGLSFGGKDYTKELKTVECTCFLDQTS